MEVLCHALPLEGLQALGDQLSQEDLSQDDQRAIIHVRP